MQKLDLKKELEHLYRPSAKKVDLVDVPAMNFVHVEGSIESGAAPGTSPDFVRAIGVLYGLAYTIKFMSKRRLVDPIDFTVMALEEFQEGLCVQTMHVGPYSDEPHTIERMKTFAEQNNLAFNGLHHEIYLGDPRTAKPENLKTVLRYPVRVVG